MAKYQPSLTVVYGDESETFGLFPPIICTSTGAPTLTPISVTGTQVVVQVLFPGDLNPFVITLSLGPVVN